MIRPSWARLAAACLAWLAGCAGSVDAPLALEATCAQEPPRWLEATGFVLDPATGEPFGELLPYTPQYPLWTDGAAKRRWIRLPAGSAIDASDPDAWDFPVGTKLWKEFAHGGRRIETRVLERLADGSWSFAAYVWDDAQERAELAPERGLRRAYVAPDGVAHDVPARADCLSCHGNGATPVLGFSALQLSPDRDPLAPHAETPRPDDVDLEVLVRGGALTGLDGDFLASPPRIVAASPRERAVLGYLHANCGGCHRAGGPLAELIPRLDQTFARGDAPTAPESLVGRSARHRSAQAGAAASLVTPGEPDHSLLAARLGTRGNALAMPPLGSARVDADALALVRSWILEDLAAPVGGADLEAHPRLLSHQRP